MTEKNSDECSRLGAWLRSLSVSEKKKAFETADYARLCRLLENRQEAAARVQKWRRDPPWYAEKEEVEAYERAVTTAEDSRRI